MIYEGNNEISIRNERFFFTYPSAHGTDYCYGLTFDKNISKLKYLREYISSKQILLQAIAEEEYEVLYGVFLRISTDEICEYISDGMKEDEWDKYTPNSDDIVKMVYNSEKEV